MSDLGTLVQEFEIAEVHSKQGGSVEVPYQPPKGHGKPPSIFIKFWILVTLVLIVVATGLLSYAFLYSPVRLLPDFRWSESYQMAGPTVVAPGPAEDNRHLWVGTEREGILRFEPAALMWRAPVARAEDDGALLADHIVGLPMVRGIVGICCESEGRRGMVFAHPQGLPKRLRFWGRPFLDFSHLGTDTGDTLTSVTAGLRPDEIVVGSAHSGIGIYHLPSRRWLEHITQASGGIGDDHVRDLYRWSEGILVAHDLGVDLCRGEGGKWIRITTISDLGSKGVSRIYARRESEDEIDVWCVTGGRGLVAFTLRRDGTVGRKTVLISERSVPGLTAESCVMADVHPLADVLWVGFRQGEGIGFARYWFPYHDWAGTEDTFPVEGVRCLRALADRSVLVGTSEGVWQVWDLGLPALRRDWRGPQKEDVTEIAASDSLVWAHTRWSPPQGMVSRRLRMTSLVAPKEGDIWRWTDLLGPSRFEGLSDEELTCAAPIPGGKDYYFGTRSKGIGRWRSASHEPERLVALDSDLAPQGVLDLTCPQADQLVAVGNDHRIHFFDGRSWQCLFTPTGLPGRPQEVVTAIAEGSEVFIATEENVGGYDMSSNQWRVLPPLKGVVQLKRLGNILWARTEEKELYALSLSGPGSSGWQKVAKDIIHLDAHGRLLVAVAESRPGIRHILLFQGGSSELVTAVAPEPLTSPLGDWTMACAAGDQLYVSGMAGPIAHYDLQTHRWEVVPLPGDGTGGKQLEATPAGLWLVDSKGELWLCDAKRRIWLEPPIYSDVQSVFGGETGLAVLMQPPADGTESARLAWVVDRDFQRILIGRPLESPLQVATAAAEFRDMLFLGSPGGWHRYDTRSHDWKTFPLEEAFTVGMFASTGDFLYGLVAREGERVGVLRRFDPGEDSIHPVFDPEEASKPIEAEFIAADGSGALAFMRKDKGIGVIMDDDPEHPRVLYPCSSSELGQHRVTCAAENGEDLCLGTDAGTVHIYGKTRDGQRRWQVVQVGQTSPKSDASGSGVRRVFFPDLDTMITVTRENIFVHKRTGGNWQLARQIFPQPTVCDAWDAGGGRILVVAFEESPSAGSQLVSRASLETLAGRSARQDLLGPPMTSGAMPLAPTAKVVEWARPNDLWLFRVGADGMFWCYSLARRGWELQPFGQVELLAVCGNTLWAYAPLARILYSLVDAEVPRWEAFSAGREIADFITDGSMLLVRYASGKVEGVWPGDRDRGKRLTLLPESPSGLQEVQGFPSALAEIGHYLVCAFASKGTYAYDVRRHQWMQAFPNEIKCFFRTDGNASGLFAVTADGRLLIWEEARQSFTERKTPGPVATAATVEELLAIATVDGGVYVSQDGSDWRPLIDPKNRLPGSEWLPITASAEWNGRLWLGLGRGGRGQLACFDPGTLRWELLEVPGGIPERFVVAANSLWLVTAEPTGSRRLFQLRSPRELGQVGKLFRNVWVHGEEIWALTDTGEVQRADFSRATWETVFPGFRPGLPVSGTVRVRSAVAAGSDLAVVLSDNSVWHHPHDGLGWRTLLPSISVQGFQRQIISVNGMLITTDLNGSILAFNPRKGIYESIAGGVDLVPIDPGPAQWEVRTAGQGLSLEVRRKQDSGWASLQVGVLPWDDYVDIAVDDQYVYLQTRAGSVRVVRKTDGQDLTAQIADQNLADRFRRPSSVAVRGTIFEASVDPQGLWEGAKLGEKIQIIVRPEAGLPFAGVMRPHAQDGHLGIACQWGGSLVGQGSTLLAAFPDGLFVFKKEGSSVVLKSVEVLPSSTGKIPLICPGDVVFAVTGDDRCFIFEPAVDKWQYVDREYERKLREKANTELSVLRQSVLGPSWALEQEGDKPVLYLTTKDGQRHPVNLGRAGLGFDRVVGMALTSTEIIFFTPDGKVTYDKGEVLGIPKALLPAQAVAPEMLDADCYTVPAPKGGQATCRARQGTDVWVLREAGWEKISSEAFARLSQLEEPLFEGRYCTWVNDKAIEIRPPAIGGGERGRLPIKTSLNLRTGRFSSDEWVSLAAHKGEIWAFSRVGLVRVSPGGFAEVYLQDDHSYDWGAGGSLQVISEEKQSWLVAAVRDRASGEERLLVWEEGTWRAVNPSESIYQIYQQRQEQILRGVFWRIDRSRVNGSPQRQLERRWAWQPVGQFTSVSIDPHHARYPDVFDFERVNGLGFFAGEIWLATDAGVIALTPSTAEITYFCSIQPGTPVSKLAEHGGTLYAEAGQVFRWEKNTRQWQPAMGENPFEYPPVLLSTNRWRVVERPKLEISYRWSADSAQLEPVPIVGDPSGGYRFEFDVVSSVLPAGRVLVLVSASGLIERSLDNPADVRRVSLPDSGIVANNVELFAFGPKEQQEIIARVGTNLFQRDSSGRWVRLAADRRSRVEPFLGKFLAWTRSWYVEKGPPPIKVRVRFPKDLRYKIAVFIEDRGLFDFDCFTDVCVYPASQNSSVVFIATEGGIGYMDAEGHWFRRYADVAEDGIPCMRVGSLARRGDSQLLAQAVLQPRGVESFYQFRREEQRWEPFNVGPETREVFARFRSLLFENPGGWAGADLKKYHHESGQEPAASFPSLSLAWRGEPVWLIEHQQRICFAHDVRYSVQWHGGELWYGTGGGVLREKPPWAKTDSSRSWSGPRLYVQDFGAKTDLWHPTAPAAVGLIKEVQPVGSPMVLLLTSPGAVGPSLSFDFSRAFKYEGGKDGFVPAIGVDPPTIARVINDGFWYWLKRGPGLLTVEFHQGRAEIPPRYVRLGKGTFRFFDLISSLPQQLPLVSISSHAGRLFVATEGGLMSFDAKQGTPAKLYALAFSETGGNLVPIKRVVGLFFSHKRKRLFARCEVPIGNSSREVWLWFKEIPGGGISDGRWFLCSEVDPLEDFDVVVDNELLTWRQKPTGADVHIKKSDVEPGTPYELFFEGKFSFDHVFSVATAGPFVWLATAGGAVAIEPENHRIERVFARCFGLSEQQRLPDLREICSSQSPKAGVLLYARTAGKRSFENDLPLSGKDLGVWREVPPEVADPAFEAAYRKDTPAPEFWSWVQPPEGIYVQIHPTRPSGLRFGASAPLPHYSLMSRGRFSWDDLRDAVLVGQELVFATPAGICVYRVDPFEEVARLKEIHGRCGTEEGAEVPMTDIERIVSEGDELAAWNRKHVFRGRRTSEGWYWEVDATRLPADMESTRRLVTSTGEWHIIGGQKGRGVTVVYLPKDNSGSRRIVLESASISLASYDLPRAVLVDQKILIPGKKGVLCIDLEFAERQKVWRPIAMAIALLSLIVATVIFAPAVSLPRK
jgi:hypothetical protein